tara:strand:- start:3262 stop:4053 length:792 start_codon:yes stop_codon:yes gene_type:complete
MDKVFDFSNKYTLITGATGKIGQSIIHRLISSQTKLILLDKDIETMENKFDKTKIKMSNVHLINYDATNENSCKDAIQDIKNITTRIDYVINSIGMVGTDDDPGWSVRFEDQSKDSWNKCLEINLTSIFFLIQKLLPLLRESNECSIVNISSIYGVIGPDFDLYEGTDMNNPAAYGVSKAGLIQLTKWLAAALSPSIRVNSVSPGGIHRNQPDIFTNKYKSKTLLGRMATEDEVSETVLFLLSKMSSYITGQNIIVDGGLTIK